MFGINELWLFIISGIILNILPGPDSLYIIGRSAAQGFRAGSAAALGIGSGTIIHILAAAFGLSAILVTSGVAFNVIKFIGAIYLLYMAFTMLIGNCKSKEAKSNEFQSASLKTIFSQGFLTNVLNPKVALFFLAFVPQFIDSEATNKAMAFIILGLIFNINGMIWCHFLAWSSSVASVKIKQSETRTKWLNRMGGGLFAYFGIRLAFSEQG